MIAILLLVLLVLIVGGVPIIASMGLAACVAFAVQGLPNYLLAQTMFFGMNSFTLLAIPLFILAGEILHRSGASAKLVHLVSLLVGWLPGGLGITAVIATMVFSGLSGSVNADAAAIGSVMIAPMITAGYSAEWASSIVAAAAGTGILIPPSISMIALGTIANLSIQSLFLAALLPALIVGASKIIVIYSRARFYERTHEQVRVTGRALGAAALAAIPPTVAPIVILGGIMFGVFTATEAAAVAVLYSALLAVAYRQFSWREVPDLLASAGRLTGVVMILVGVASTVGYILARAQVSNAMADYASGLTGNFLLFIAVMILLFWVMGALMDGLPALIILIPLFLPISARAGMHPIHFAIFTLAIIGISLVTPPLGTACFVVAGISKTNIGRMIVPMLPFILILFATMLLIAYIPSFSLWLPGLFHRV